ncbi:MAG: uroporphyrinogen decarboxylase [Verrucomicrobiae bacterium]|nr:uroporphyrinogen decarboxylase [Verrucomicrobiae bacterium]
MNAPLTARQRFINACRCRPNDRPPVWLMRQAGRVLPEYRALKQTYTFVELVQNPELAVEVTLQPVRRFGFDAAILFSDILVIPEALGQRYYFKETGGVQMDFAVTSRADIEKLSVAAVGERLSYVERALRALRQELGDQTALIGFSGSPWTLATFMMEGASVPKYSRALALFREDPKTYFLLAEKLTEAISAYLKMQAATGVDALQIFDSHGGHLAASEFSEASGRWISEIIARLGETSTPKVGAGERSAATAENHVAPAVIVFSLGAHGNWPELTASGANVIGVDWQTELAVARQTIPAHIGIQGNLRPQLLVEADPEAVRHETLRILETMHGRPGHIFNLGHGLTPGARLENIQALVDTVKQFRADAP